MRSPLVACAIVIGLALAGCIQPQDANAPQTAARVAPPVDRVDGMTVSVQKVDNDTSCDSQSLGIPQACAERVLTATGRIGIDHLPVDLSSVNGAITITANSVGDAWSFVADVKVRALTKDAARAGLDSAWTWGHERDGKHILYASDSNTTPTVAGVSAAGATVEKAEYRVTLPQWVVTEIVASNTNGAISIQGPVTSVGATTTNGAVSLIVTPTQSGKIHATSTNGAVNVNVPETRANGYDIKAKTTNGAIKILLVDGDVQNDAAKYGGSSSASFQTRGYEQRAIQTTMDLSTTNGEVVVS